jgi:hypothetical protein
MKLTKSLLLASVAGFAAVASAQAADLPSKKAAPVEYVKVCPTYGPGFFYIPGTTTCLRIGGLAEFQGYGINKYTQASMGTGGTAGTKSVTDAVNSHEELRIFLDARDTTEYGMLRTFARIQWARSSGSDDNSGSQPRRGQMFAGSGSYANLQTGFYGSEAFVQLGGALFGRTTSFAWVGAPSLQFTTQNPSNGRVNQVAYTASLGNGMSLTAGIEDAAELREGTFATTDGTAANSKAVLTPANSAPDAIASFDVSQGWGSVKVAGVLHEVYVSKYTAGAQTDSGASAKTGYAGMAGAKINLPMIAAGDYVYGYAAYALGALGRTLGNTATDTANSAAAAAGAGGNASFGMGNATWGGYDAIVNTTSGAVTLSKSYSFGGEFKHYFAPTVAAYVGGSFGAVNYGSAKMGASTSGLAAHNANMWGAALGLIWSPVAGLEINPEVAYRKANITSDAGVTNGNKTGVKSDDQYIGRLRVARSF